MLHRYSYIRFPMRYLLPALLCLFSPAVLCQDLLVNGGLEEENICTEYRINCAPEAWISSSSGFANYFKDANRAHAGLHCMAIEAGHVTKPFQRTFIRSALVCGLRKGGRYRLSFFIKSPHPVLDSIGVSFTSTDPLLETKPLHRWQPSLLLGGAGLVFATDSSWQRVELVYTASGEEAFIAIGNFSKRDITGDMYLPMESHFFVFFDDFSLLPDDPAERICNDWQQTREDIYGQDERHEFLQRSLKYRRSQAPAKVQRTPNLLLRADTLLLPDMWFATGKKDLQPAGFRLLDSFCIALRGKALDSLVIEGHADNTGSRQLNESLSQARAEVVAIRLSQCIYMARVPLTVRGSGSRRPVASNETEQGRQQNRRVEMMAYFRE
ncbi:MAG: OmpA family protein [Chitinophagaceae bacterium]